VEGSGGGRFEESCAVGWAEEEDSCGGTSSSRLGGSDHDFRWFGGGGTRGSRWCGGNAARRFACESDVAAIAARPHTWVRAYGKKENKIKSIIIC